MNLSGEAPPAVPSPCDRGEGVLKASFRSGIFRAPRAAARNPLMIASI